MRYSVPLTALKVTALVVLGYRTSSLEATRLSALTVVRIWTPRSVSNALPAVLKVTVPLAGATQRNQTEAPPVFPAWFGSPASLVAPTVLPDVVPETPAIVVALAKLSLAGAALAVKAALRIRSVSRTPCHDPPPRARRCSPRLIPGGAPSPPCSDSGVARHGQINSVNAMPFIVETNKPLARAGQRRKQLFLEDWKPTLPGVRAKLTRPEDTGGANLRPGLHPFADQRGADADHRSEERRVGK